MRPVSQPIRPIKMAVCLLVRLGALLRAAREGHEGPRVALVVVLEDGLHALVLVCTEREWITVSEINITDNSE